MFTELQGYSPSDEQIQICLFGTLQISSHTAKSHIIEQLFFLHTHDIHTHGAGDKLHPLLTGLGNERLQTVNLLFLHQKTHHLAADAHHVHLRQLQCLAVRRKHPREHTAPDVFFHCRLLALLEVVFH